MLLGSAATDDDVEDAPAGFPLYMCTCVFLSSWLIGFSVSLLLCPVFTWEHLHRLRLRLIFHFVDHARVCVFCLLLLLLRLLFCILFFHLAHTETEMQQSEQHTHSDLVKSSWCHEQITSCNSEEQLQARWDQARGPEWSEWCRRDAFIVASFPLSCVRLSESQSLVLICRTFTPFSCCLAALIKVKPFLLFSLLSSLLSLHNGWDAS